MVMCLKIKQTTPRGKFKKSILVLEGVGINRSLVTAVRENWQFGADEKVEKFFSRRKRKQRVCLFVCIYLGK